MRLLLVQLSDIHFKTGSDPVLSRVQAIWAAIRSTGAPPDACLFLITGDIAWSGQEKEYDQASAFFRLFRNEITLDLKNTPVVFVAIPGNHDCFLPKEKLELRSVVVAAAEKMDPLSAPDEGISLDLLSAQDNFFNFVTALDAPASHWKEKLCSHRKLSLSGKIIRVNLFNSAFLSQRDEKQNLSMPQFLLENQIIPDPAADLTISLHHHSEGWLEANFKRFFRKLIETTSDIVFTGHEHQNDYHLTQNLDGISITYVEGEALQDAEHPSRSGFNCLMIDFTVQVQKYFLFRWKTDRYAAVVDGAEHPLRINTKGGAYFRFNERYSAILTDDHFGFRNSNRSSLKLDDIFVYPSAIHPLSASKRETVSGENLLDEILKSRFSVFYGPDLSGKTALLKTLQRDIFSSTAMIPVMLSGSDLTTGNEDNFVRKVWSFVRSQYSEESVEDFRQLPRERRALLIDNIDDSQLRPEVIQRLLERSKEYFGVIVATMRSLLSNLHLYAPSNKDEVNKRTAPVLKLFVLGEMQPSARGKLIRKWLSLDASIASDGQRLSKAIESEEATINFLIGKHVLPALPYLVLSALQARQRGRDDMLEPGSFGYIVQRIVIDALSVSSNGRKPMMERKDYLLRSLAHYLYVNGQRQVSEREFDLVVSEHATKKMMTVDASGMLEDLLEGRVLEKVDGSIAFKYEHFQHYFLALHFIDGIDSENEKTIREHLNRMADKPLVKPNRLTLIFFLFFRKRDPIIDRLIKQANETFSDHAEADLLSDLPGESESTVLASASVDEDVDVEVERNRRWAEEDKKAEASTWDPASKEDEMPPEGDGLDITYQDATSDSQRIAFASERLGLLGQIIRNFPDSLEGTRKVEILEAAIRLGLRTLHVGLQVIRNYENILETVLQGTPIAASKEAEQLMKAWRMLTALLGRVGCYMCLLDISQAVGVQDMEEAYAKAIERIGETPATRLVELAIMLDQGATFPFVEAQRLDKFLPKNANMAQAVMSDLIVRHTKRFVMKRETLRRIAGLIKVKVTSLSVNSEPAK